MHGPLNIKKIYSFPHLKHKRLRRVFEKLFVDQQTLRSVLNKTFRLKRLQNVDSI